MSVLLRSRPSPAMVVACLAISLALAGSAVAGTEAVTSKLDKKEKRQIKRLAKQQANKQITRRAAGLSVAHAGTADNATNAAKASTATTASNADKVDGVDAHGFSFTSDAVDSPTDVVNLGGLTITVNCAGGTLTVQATTSTNNALINAAAFDSGGAINQTENHLADDNFDVGETLNLLGTDRDLVTGQIEYTPPGGPPVSVTYQAADPFTGPSLACAFSGHALAG